MDQESMNDAGIEHRRNWHLDKSVNLPFLLALFLAGMGAIGYIINADQRVTRIEANQESMKIIDIKLNDDNKSIKADLKSDLTRIESKLDRVIEKRR